MTTEPVPFGVILMSPFVSVDVIELPLMLILSTSKSPVISVAPVIAVLPLIVVAPAARVPEPTMLDDVEYTSYIHAA